MTKRFERVEYFIQGYSTLMHQLSDLIKLKAKWDERYPNNPHIIMKRTIIEEEYQE